MNLMEQLAQLRVEHKAKVDAATKALEAGKLDEAKSLRAEAETLRGKAELVKAMIDEAKALDGLLPAAPEPVRPSLPGLGGGGNLPQAGGNGDNPPPDSNGMAVKAAYVARFGEPDSAVKAILSDLYGSEEKAAAAYWTQKAAFNKYLRYGEARLDRDEWKALKTVILTPAAIRDAMKQGADDVLTLKATMVEGVETLGGFAVPVDFQSRVISRMQGLTVMRGRAFGMNTSSNAVEIPTATGGDSQYTSAVRETWVSETPAAAASETNLTFGMERIDVNTAMANTPISKNLAEDAAFGIEAYLAEKFAEAAAVNEDNTFLTGSGNGRPEGILPNSTNGLSLTEVVTGDANLVTWDGLIGLAGGIDSQYRAACAYIMEKATAVAIAKLKDGNGQYLWREQFGNNVAGQPRNLNGFPVLEQEAMPSVAANAYPIIFGDPRGYLIVDRVGMTVQRYDDSTTAATNTFKYVMRRRLGGQVTEPWRFVVQKVAAA